MAVNYNSRFHGGFEIIGISSFEQSCKINKVYTRVAPYVNWIESVVWK